MLKLSYIIYTHSDTFHKMECRDTTAFHDISVNGTWNNISDRGMGHGHCFDLTGDM